MKKKKLALLLAAAMTVTSIDSTAMMVNAADFASEEVQEQSVEFTGEELTDEGLPEVNVDTDAESEDGETFSDDSSADESIEIAEEPEESVDIEGEDGEIGIQEEEEVSADDVFGAEDEIAVQTEDEETPDVTEMELDTVYTADIDEEGKRVWYSFTPSESGTYSIYSTGSFDTFVELCERLNGDQLDKNDDGAENNNFRLSYTLEAGKTYYYCARMYNSDVVGSFEVQIEKVAAMQSMSASDVLTEGIVGLPFYTDAKLSFVYGEDDTRELRFGYNTSSASGEYATNGQTVTATLTDAQGYTYGLGRCLAEGTYTMKFVCGDLTSESYKVQIKKAQDSSLYKGALEADKEATIQTPHQGCAYYSLKSARDAWYFTNFASGYSNYSILRKDPDGDGYYEEGRPWYQAKDETAYLCFYGGNLSDSDSESAVVTVGTRSDIVSMSYKAESDTMIAGLDQLRTGSDMPGSLTLTYKNGKTYTLRPTIGSCVYDPQEYGIDSTVYTLDEKNQETPFDWGEGYDNSLPAGRYKVYFTVDSGSGDSQIQVQTSTILTVSKLDYKSLPELKEGVNKIETSEYRPKWYRFSPWKSGLYSIDWQFVDNSNSKGFGRDWYQVVDGEIVECYYGDMESGQNRLEKDAQYVVGVLSSAENPVALEIQKQPEATGVENLSYSPNPMNFISGFGDVDFDRLKVTVLFDDGTKKNIGRGYDVANDWLLETDLVDSAGESVDKYGNVPAGDYKYILSYRNIKVAEIPVKVSDPETQIAGTLEENKAATVQNKGTKTLFKFVPQTSGRYEMTLNIAGGNVELKDADGITIRSADGDSARIIYGALEAGNTYYLAVNAASRYQEITVTPKLLADPVKLSVKALKTNYTEDVDTFDPSQFVTTITYNDGTTEKAVDSRTARGLEVRYQGTYNGETRELYSGIRLGAGEWKIIPYLEESYYSSDDDDDDDYEDYSLERSADIVSPTVEEATITVNKLNVSSLPTLTKDKAQSVKATVRAIYRFVPDKDGFYVMNATGSASAQFYGKNEDEDSEEYWSIYGSSSYLKKGTEYILVVEAYTDSSITVSERQESAGDHPTPDSTTADFTLKDGLTKTISIAKAGDVVSASFTPSETEYYTIKAKDIIGKYDDGEYLPTIGLYCDGVYIDGGNTYRQVKLEKGKKYTFKLSLVEDADESVPTTGSFTLLFNRVVVKDITKMELVLSEGCKASDCTVFDEINNFYDVKITYADKTTKVYNNVWGEDEFGNNWDMIDVQDETTSYNSQSVKHQVHFQYWNLNIGEWKDLASQTIYTSAIGAFGELKLNTKVTPFADGKYKKYYRFKAPETGTYLLESSMAGKYVLSAIVYSVDGIYSEDYWNVTRDWVDTTTVDACKNQVYLTKGQTYVIGLNWYYDTDGSTSTFQIKKQKTLKSIKMTKHPDQTSVLPGSTAAVLLNGMEITATYTDGTTEVIPYGKKDSQGMEYSQYGEYRWVNDQTCRVPVCMGNYFVYVDFTAADWSKMPELKLDKEEEIAPLSRGYEAYYRFVPTASGFYSFSTGNGYATVEDSRTGSDLNEESAYLEAGVTYRVYVWISDLKQKATVKVRTGSCFWEVIENVAATCTKDGKVVKKCKTHGDTRTMTDSARGHHWGGWKVAKAATCADGEEQRTCSLCKTVEKRAIKATQAHKFSAWKVTKKATVLATGTQQRKCSVCGRTETASVKKLPATIALNVKGTIPLKVKQTFTVKVTTGAGDKVKSWKSSNSKFVSVKNGKIKGLKAGKSATITVQLVSGKKASFKVSVQKAAVATKSIKVTNAANGKNQGKSVTLKRGKSLKLAVALTPVTSTDKVTWSTSNKKIATVSKSGVIKAVKKGKATITVKSGKKSYKITVTVK